MYHINIIYVCNVVMRRFYEGKLMVNESIPVYSIDQKATGWKIGELIDEKGYSNQEIADILGLTLQAIYKWRYGLSLPTLDNFYMLSQILEKSMDELIVPEKSHYVVQNNTSHLDEKYRHYSGDYQISSHVLFLREKSA